MFHAVDVVVVNKIDLLPHVDVDGVDEWCDWLVEAQKASRPDLASRLPT